jgi:hypothetical protein
MFSCPTILQSISHDSALVRAIALSCETPRTLTIRKSKTPQHIDEKFSTNDEVNQISECAENDRNGFRGSALIYVPNVTSKPISLFFSLSGCLGTHQDRTAHPIDTFK